MTQGPAAAEGAPDVPQPPAPNASPVPLRTIAREWLRIGCLGFGGPPAHIALLRTLCVTRRGWIDAEEFEHTVAATGLLPGPASTQLAIFLAWRLRGRRGALLGGACFIVPGLVLILALSALFLQGSPPLWARGAAAGAGAAVAAVAAHAAVGLVPSSWKRAGGASARAAHARWIVYALIGGTVAATIGQWLVLFLIALGLTEVIVRTRGTSTAAGDGPSRAWPVPFAVFSAPAVAATGGLLAVAWVAFKVGALSYGGGFVIIPLMQTDAVDHYHWMTAGQFLNAVALGQITPGPVVQTVAAVGYAAAGVGGGLLAAAVAFAPSFLFVLCGGARFDRVRTNPRAQAFLTGAGPAVIGAIAGAAVPLTAALQHLWQFGVLALAAAWLLAARRGVVSALLGAALLGVAAALAGWPTG